LKVCRKRSGERYVSVAFMPCLSSLLLLPPLLNILNPGRLAHPGGPLATNKAVALGKFLKRKLSEPGGAASLDPALVEQAVNNAKATVEAGKGQLLKSGVKVLHVDSFSGSDKEDDQLEKTQKPAKIRKKKKFNKQIANQQIKQDNGMKKKGKKNKMPKKFKF
jgi:hypothetical protein